MGEIKKFNSASVCFPGKWPCDHQRPQTGEMENLLLKYTEKMLLMPLVSVREDLVCYSLSYCRKPGLSVTQFLKIKEGNR